MGSDAAILNASSPRDLGRKKKTNRSARLKQCKRDVRREQWLSQGKSKACKGGGEDFVFGSSPDRQQQPHACDQMNAENMDARSRVEGDDKGRNQVLSIDIPITKPWENSSEIDCPNSSVGSLTTGSGLCSRSPSDADDYDEDVMQSGGGEEGGLDDWEAIADALTTAESPPTRANKDVNVSYGATAIVKSHCDPNRGILRTPPPESRLLLRAWKPDDASRPRSLPKITKQRVHCKNLPQNCGSGGLVWLYRNFDFQPTSCPICYEDLDMTDSSFLPCSCGFRLCLFCHKKILEADGRCPGCRKQYGSVVGRDMPVAGGASSQCSFMSQSRTVNAKP